MKDCIFCNIKHEVVWLHSQVFSGEQQFYTTEGKSIVKNDLFIAVRDNFPVTQYHTLLIPKRHTAEIFDLSRKEVLALHEILNYSKEELMKIDATITGFNVGFNNGAAAGQTIEHAHVHLIPRRKDDIGEDPTGGIRNVIPGKGKY